MRRAGSASPEATSAARTRSLASLTALSGNPTILKAGSPGATCPWTSTARASMPSKATVETRWTMPLPARNRYGVVYPEIGRIARTVHEQRELQCYSATAACAFSRLDSAVTGQSPVGDASSERLFGDRMNQVEATQDRTIPDRQEYVAGCSLIVWAPYFWVSKR